jgi:hypothetical protein
MHYWDKLSCLVRRSMNSKATGKDIIIAILENMRESAEPLLYRTLVPSRYDIYLHPEDYSRLSGIFASIREECIEVLNKELAGLGKKGFAFLPGLKQHARKYEASEKNWAIEFHQDEDGELAPGDLLIDSRLALPAPVEYGAGTRTQRSETIRSGGETRRLRKYQQETAQENATPIARLTYKDKDGQEREFLMKAAEISVGRGGQTEFCDFELQGPADISRQHFYLRQDKETREFFIQDVSKFGTSVDGVRLTPKEWTRISSKAAITLADRMTIEFQQL